MKKLLAMALAIATVASYAIVGANAADFNDQSKITHTEAVKVLNAAGVIIGDQNGNFNPTDKLDRASAAKIIAYLDIGETAAEGMPEQQVFDDVPASHWASRYIGYCATAGYITGDGQGHFFPDQELDQYSFGKMLQAILGYDAQIEGLVGDQWKLKIAALSSKIDLTKDLNKVGSEALTREEGARMALNALKANTVEYTNKGSTVTVGTDTTISIGASQATPVLSTESYARDINRDDAQASGNGYILQLGEKLYKGDLKKSETNDDMGNLADRWTWKSSFIGEYAKAADYKFVVKKETKDIKWAVGEINSRFTCGETDTGKNTTYYLNGEKIDDKPTATGKTYAYNTPLQVGDVVSVKMYSDDVNRAKNVTVTRYKSVKLTGDTTTKGSGDSMEVRVPGVTSGYVKVEYITGYQDLVKDDIVYYASGNASVEGEKTTYHIYKPTMIEGQITQFKNISNDDPERFTINGTVYNRNRTVGDKFDSMDKSSNFNTAYLFYLDENGIIVYAKKNAETSTDFVAVENIYLDYNAGTRNYTTYARVIHQDGTIEVHPLKSVKFNDDASRGTVGDSYGVIEYNKDNNNTSGTLQGLYTLVTTSTGTSGNLNTNLSALCARKSNASTNRVRLFVAKVTSNNEFELEETTLNNDDYKSVTDSYTGRTKLEPSSGRMSGTSRSFTVNDSTVFVVRKNANSTGNPDPEYTVYTGKNNAPSFYADASNGNVYYVAATDKDNVASIVYVYAWGVRSGAGNTVFVVSNEPDGYTKIGDTNNVPLWTVLRDGELVQIPVDSGVSRTLETYGGVVEISATYDDDGKLDSIETSDGNVEFTSNNSAPASTKNNKALGGNDVAHVSDYTSNFTDFAYGYKLSGGTLSIGKTYNADSLSKSFSAPSSAPVVFKDKDGNFTTGTVADLDKDDNDQIYVVCTDDKAATVKYVLIVERDSDNDKVAKMYYVLDEDTYTYTANKNAPVTRIRASENGNSYTLSLSSVDIRDKGHLILETEAGTRVVSSNSNAKIRNMGGNDGLVWRIELTSSGTTTLSIYDTDDTTRVSRTITLNWN